MYPIRTKIRGSAIHSSVTATSRFQIAERVFRVAGVLLFVVAAIHLLVTPLFARFVAGAVPPGSWLVIGPPSLLNHVVVGILLIPTGAAALFVAPQLADRRARRLAWVTALSVAVLPVCLVLLMRGDAYSPAAFRTAEALVTLVGVILPATLLWLPRT